MDAPYCQGPDWKPRASTKQDGTCGACGEPLVGRNRWFCRAPWGKGMYVGENEPTTCRDLYSINHFWGEARQAAIRRDKGKCRRCGEDAAKTWERAVPYGRGVKTERQPAEVNHIEPRKGEGYGNGCWNHQDNLETLCHGCHLLTTAEQRGPSKAQGARTERKERDQEKLRRWEEAAK